MPKRSSHYQTHDFYCLNCGHKAIPIMRNSGYDHERCHRKKLYCPFCRLTCNAIEIKTYEEKEWFLEEFKKGTFQEEAVISINECRGDNNE